MDDCCFGLMGVSKVDVLVCWIAAARIIEIFVYLGGNKHQAPRLG